MPKKTSSESLSMAARERKWRTEADLDTLMRAEEIESDPQRLAAAKKLAKERLADLKDVVGEGSETTKKGA